MPGSRAVTRLIDPGNSAYCAVCDGLLKYAARRRQHQVIANVYVNGRWDRVEHYHPEHYIEAGEPYGPPLD